MGESSKREGIYVYMWIYIYMWLVPFVIQQKLTQHCEATTAQFKKTRNKNSDMFNKLAQELWCTFKFVNYWLTRMCVCYNEVRPLHGVPTIGSEAKRIRIEIPVRGQRMGGSGGRGNMNMHMKV